MSNSCRQSDGRCAVCGGDWSVCGCQRMLDRSTAAAPTPPVDAVPGGYWLAPMEPDEEMRASLNTGPGRWVYTNVETYQRMRDSWLARHPVDAVPGEPVAKKAREEADAIIAYLRASLKGNDYVIRGVASALDDLVALAASVASRAGSEPVATDQAVAVPEASPDYSEMSREQLERHAVRMAQLLTNDRAIRFYDKHAFGPLAAPSCLCCGRLPEKVAIKHMELPGVVVCELCRDRALAAPSVLPAHEVDEADFDANLADPPTSQDSAPIAPAAAAEPSEPVKRCSNCDDSGQVSSITGEWHGRCHCEAGRSASPLFAPDRERAASLEGMVLVPRELIAAAQAVIERWDTPLWKDAPHTAIFINRMREAIDAARSSAGEAQS